MAAEAAYDECEDWLDQVVEYIDGTHGFVDHSVRTHLPDVKYVKPEGTFLAWLDVRRPLDRVGAAATAAAEDRSPEAVFQELLVDNAHIHVNPGSIYGSGGAGRMRMNIATSRQLVERARGNMRDALARLQRLRG